MTIILEQFLQMLPGSNAWLLLLLTICRTLGFFLLSPLFSAMYITHTVRFFLACFTGLLIALVLYPHFMQEALILGSQGIQLQVVWLCATELFLGYIIGFIFSLVFDSMKLAGELIDTLTGMSAGQIFDPISNTFQTLTGQLLLLFGILIMLSIDFHHVIIRIVAESFQLVPLGHFQLHGVVFSEIVDAGASLFQYALKIAVIPLVLITICLAGIALTIRVIPEMNLLFIGVPMRFLIGLLTLILATGHMPPVFKQAFWYYAKLVVRLF